MLSPKRNGRLTASNFAAACGLNPYQSTPELYRQLAGIDPPFTGNEMTQWGADNECNAVDAYEAEMGVIVDRSGDNQEFIIHSEFDWLGCTTDGFNGEIVTEFKCPYRRELYKEIPVYYMPQIQGQMAITGKKLCHFVCWTPDELAVWQVDFNEDYWNKEFKFLERFYKTWKDEIEPSKLKKPTMPEVSIMRIL